MARDRYDHEIVPTSSALAASASSLIRRGVEMVTLLQPALPALLTPREVSHFKYDSDYTNSVAFSPDGRFLACGHSCGSIYLQKLPEGSPVWKGPGGLRNPITFSPDSQWLLIGDSPTAVHTGTGLSSYSALDIPGDYTNTITLLPDGKRLFVGTPEGFGCIQWRSDLKFDLVNWLDWSEVETISSSPDGKTVLVGGGYNTGCYLRLLDTTTLNQVASYDPEMTGVTSALFLPDGKRALIGGAEVEGSQRDDTPLVLLDLERDLVLRRFSVDEYYFHVHLTPDGRHALTTHDAYTQRDSALLWDIQAGCVVAEIGGIPMNEQGDRMELQAQLPRDRQVTCATLSADGRLAAIGFMNGSVRLYSLHG